MTRRRRPPRDPAAPLPRPPASPPGVPIWQCPNCGQSYFGAQPPDLCDYCQDFTTWRPLPPDKKPLSSD